MLYNLHSVKLYDQDADNFMHNRVTVIVHFSTAYKSYRVWARLPAQMMEDKEAVKEFMEHRIHSYLAHHVWGKSIAMIRRIKAAGRRQAPISYIITSMDILECSSLPDGSMGIGGR